MPILADGLPEFALDPAVIAIEIQPGRALFGDSSIHLTTVRNVKHETTPFVRTWVETETSAPGSLERGDIVAVLDTGALTGGERDNDVFRRDLIPTRLAWGDGVQLRSGWQIKGLDLVAVTSGDLDRSQRLYRDLLGLHVRDQGEASNGEIANITGVADSRVRWAGALPVGVDGSGRDVL